MSIHWSPEEHEQVIANGAQLMLKTGTVPDLNLAQAVLPEDRRRPLNSKGVVTQIRRDIRRRYTAATNSVPKDAFRNKARVRWTDEERQQVIQEGVRLYLAHGVKETAIAAQRVLPTDRQRPMSSSVRAEVNRWIAAGIKAAESAPKPNGEDKGAIHQQPVAEASAPVIESPAALDAPPPRVVDLLVDALVERGAEIVSRIAAHETVREKLGQLVAGLLVGVFKPAPQPAPVQQETPAEEGAKRNEFGFFEPVKPRVLIAGLEPRQIEDVKARYSAKLDLRFWKKDQSKEQLKRQAKEADIIFGITKFISHPAEQSMRSVASDKYVRHAYGVTSLLPRLEQIIHAGVAAVKPNTH